MLKLDAIRKTKKKKDLFLFKDYPGWGGGWGIRRVDVLVLPAAFDSIIS